MTAGLLEFSHVQDSWLSKFYAFYERIVFLRGKQ